MLLRVRDNNIRKTLNIKEFFWIVSLLQQASNKVEFQFKI